MINDGTVKWEIRKIAEAENSRLLNGKTYAQIINETLVQVPKGISISVIVGTIVCNAGRGGTIPLPSGYTREQCKYFINYIEGFYRDESYSDGYFNTNSVNQSNGAIAGFSSHNSYTLPVPYLCIAVK